MIFDRKTNQFRAANGRFIRREAIRAEIEKAVDVVGRKAETIAKDLNAGKINLPEFQIRMKENLKSAHILSASVSKGGYRSMSPSDWSKVGNELKKQYAYLNKYARDIELGRVSPVQIENRAKSYSNAIRAVYANGEKEAFKSIGKTEARRALHSLESCSECASWAAKGWVGIDEIAPLGSLICKIWCRCSLEYR